MSKPQDLPAPVATLVSQLVEAGFPLVGERGSGQVNRVLELGGVGLSVRLLGDRGQWWMETGLPGRDSWYDADIWAWCVDDQGHGEPSPLEDQVRYVITHHDRLLAAARLPETWDCLDRRRAQRARERLGLPPRT